MCSLRVLSLTARSYPRTAEDEEKAQQVWLKGHTGMSFVLSIAFTLLTILNALEYW